MADKSVGELIAAQSVTPTDLFVLEQNGTAKKLTGQILENWLVSFADGHGGIQSISKLSTSGLVDTYRITLADTSTFDFVVNNGRGITSISKTSVSGLVDTYTISYNDGTSGTLTVTNGKKGDKGDNAYVWIKYASQKPTESSHSIGDIPDDWIGIYSGNASIAPTAWTQYQWFQIKGEKGDTGSEARLLSQSIRYQTSSSGTVVPSGTWLNSIPEVIPGQYLWTQSTLQFNSGTAQVAYTVSRFGMDGAGSVSSVNNKAPDSNGNVNLTTEDIGLYPVGSIYISTVSTSPASLFGGTWTQIKDRFLLAAGSSYSAGTTGGAKTVTLTEAQLPTITPGLYVESSGGTAEIAKWTGYIKDGYWGQANSAATSGYASLATKPFGSGNAVNIMPPYLAVYIWERTA